MFPREHGAYGQLLFPMATALAIGRPGEAALAWAAASACAFLAHEPLVVLLGLRGARASREQRDRAWRWFGSLVAIAGTLAARAFFAMPEPIRPTVAVPGALGLIVAIVIFARREHTWSGEVTSALAMASLAWPAAIASGAASVAAQTCVTVFGAGFAASTLAVHAVIARTRRPPAARARAAGAAVAAAVLWLLWYGSELGILDGAAPMAVLPMAAVAAAAAIIAPSAARLRRIGWALVGASSATSVILIAALRTP